MTESRARFLLEALIAGLIGYVTVVLFFALLNISQGRSIWYTAALLGSSLFYGLEQPSELVVAAEPVIAFNGVHLALFLLAGAFMAWLAGVVERVQQGWYLGIIVFLIVLPHVFGLPVWFADAVQAEIPLWFVVLATSVAALGMGAFLLAFHPRLRLGLQDTGRD
jgi:hypothetical protein